MSMSMDTFFAPTQYDAFDFLIEEYERVSNKLLDMHKTLVNDSLLQFLIDTHSRILSPEEMLTKYRSYMWQRALNMTDVRDFMPTELRNAWTRLVEKGDGSLMTPRLQLESGFITDINNPIKFDGVPEFTEEGVRGTIGVLMSMRYPFLLSMVDGIFFHLSGEHVTNRPEGFSKRFIIDNVYTQDAFGINFGLYSKVEYIHDLRFTVGKLLKRDPTLYATSNGDTDDVLKSVVSQVGYGDWCWIDGNAIRVRCYKKGTVHIELHPDITWQLNALLAEKHPNAIPSKFTKQPNQKRKDHPLIDRVIPDVVCRALRGFTYVSEHCGNTTIRLNGGYHDKWVTSEITNIMAMIGGAPDGVYGSTYVFEYDVRDVMYELVNNRTVPDAKSHQFYPSPDEVVSVVCDAVSNIGGVKTVCEPSCGTGNILSGLSNTGEYDLTGYEINELFAKVARGRVPAANVHTGDFIDVVGKAFDAIAMNPPFDQGRWLEHVKHAITLSKHVIAVLPVGASCGKVGCKFTELQTIKNAFKNTSIDVKVVHFFH